MSELRAEQSEESGAGGETQKAFLTPFLTKTYQLVDDPAVDDFISWNEDGTGFIIWRPAEFARDLLPKYFKHNNLSSFVRQLNTYGFRKVVPDRWEFANDFFKKGEKGLLREIQRRKMTQLGSVASPASTAAEGPSTVQVMQSSVPKSDEEQMVSSSGGTKQPQVTDSTTPAAVEESEGGNVVGSKSTSPELRKENQRLELENQQMMDELSHLKGLCNNIFSLMANYGPSGQQDPGNMSMESKQLDLLQSGKHLEEQGGSSGGGAGATDDKEGDGDGDRSPRLFGVSIGAKRRKRNDDDESSHMQQQQPHQQDEARTENYNYSNTAQSERKQKPGPS